MLATDAGRTLRHELAHALHHAHMDALGQQHPVWVQEGLASLLESAAHHDHSAGKQNKGFTIESNERDAIIELMIERDRALPLQQFFDLGEEEFERDAGSHYAQARSILRYLAEAGGLESWYAEYCAAFADDPTGAQAMETVLGRPLAQIEIDWRSEVARRTGGGNRLPAILAAMAESNVAGPPPAAEQPERESHGSVEAMYQRIRPRMLHEYREAIPALREIVAMDPHHAAARYDLGLALNFVGDREEAEAERAALDRLDRNLASLLESAMRNRERVR
jgi:hypothetical protein